MQTATQKQLVTLQQQNQDLSPTPESLQTTKTLNTSDDASEVINDLRSQYTISETLVANLKEELVQV